ncbi:MAG: TonB-dependent receptor [Steroidobacteraceae bacterium]
MKKKFLGSAGLALGLISISNTYAQETETVGLEEIVVTAEKRTADSQKTAIAITTITGEEMARKSLQTIKQVLETVPNLQVASAAQGGIVFLRGIGSNSDSNYVDSDVAVSVDGVYGGRSEGVLNAAYDLQRVEVLRGPQGTLSGRNAIGGAVNVLSANPTHEFEATMNAQLGNYSLAHLDASVNLPVGDSLAFRVSGMRETRDGYASNGGWASNLAGGRVKALWEPSDKLKIVGTAELNTQLGYAATTYPNDSSPFFASAGSCPLNLVTHVQTCATTGGLNGSGGYAIFNPNGTAAISPNGQPVYFSWPTDPNDPWYVDPYHQPAKQDMRFRTFTLNVDWDVGFAKATIIPAYSYSRRISTSSLVTGDIQGNVVNTLVNPPTGSPSGTLPTVSTTILVPYYPIAQGAAQTQDFTEKQTTVEARLASNPDSKLIWVVGGLYLDSTNQPTTLGAAATYPGSGTGYISYPAERPTKSNSIFAQATYPIVEALRVTGGIRYNKDSRKYPSGLKTVRLPVVNATTGAITNTPFVTGCGANVNTGGLATCTATSVPLVDTGVTYTNASYSATTWKAGIEYDLAPQSMLYADVSTGYKAGGFSISGAQIPYKPEYLTSYDLGIKNRFLDNTLQVNANAYYYIFDDYQISAGNVVGANVVCDPAFTPGVDYVALGLCQPGANNVTATAIPALATQQWTFNGGTGKTYGVEVETQWLFTPNNKLDLSVSYLHARYGKIDTKVYYALDALSYQVASDAPEWSGNIGLEHYFNFKNGGQLTLRGESKISTWYWNSVTRFDENSTTQIQANGVLYPLMSTGRSASSSYQPGYTRSNAYLTYAFPDKQWSLTGWVKNIENKAQKTNSFPRNRVWLSDPQTYGVNISAKF